MKSRLLLASAIFGLPGMAIAADLYAPPIDVQPPPPAHNHFAEIRGAVGYSFLDGNAVDEDGEATEYLFGNLSLRAGWNSGTGWLLQGDLRGELTDADDDDSYAHGYSAFGHLAHRDASHLFGAFGGYGQAENDNDGEGMAEFYAVGFEAQHYLAQSTLYAQGGFLDSNDPDGEAIRDAWFGRLAGRHYFTPNRRLELGIAGATGTMDTDDEDVWLANWSVSLEHQFGLSPLSAFVGYDGIYAEQDETDDGNELTEHAVKLGLSYAFGAGSADLMSRDREGATLDTPDFVRWIGLTGGQLE